MNDDDLVAGYLGRLVRAARTLPADRRADLIDEIADHIEEARAASEASGPDVSDLLLRLGEPEAIVAAASDSPGDFPRPGQQPAYPAMRPSAEAGPRRQGWLDLAAVLLVLGSVLLSAVSFVLALLGWAVGIVILLLSPRWPKRAKVLGAVTGTLALVLFGELLDFFAKEWNRFYWQRPALWLAGRPWHLRLCTPGHRWSSCRHSGGCSASAISVLPARQNEPGHAWAGGLQRTTLARCSGASDVGSGELTARSSDTP